MVQQVRILLPRYRIGQQQPHFAPNDKKSHHTAFQPGISMMKKTATLPHLWTLITTHLRLLWDEAQINTEIRANFRTYVSFAYEHLLPFSRAEATAIRLLLKLRKTKASLQTYESIMEWHLRETQKLQNWQSLADCEDYISREKMFKSLKKRYNIDDEKFLQVKPHILPHSRTKVNIVLNDAQCVLQSLLTDPRISDEDYIFFNNDPFQPPPEEVTSIKDLNTGQSY